MRGWGSKEVGAELEQWVHSERALMDPERWTKGLRRLCGSKWGKVGITVETWYQSGDGM